jgi:Protein of unknown function (DUF2752)
MAERSVPEQEALAAADRPWRLVIGMVLPLGLVLAPRFLSFGDIPLCAFKHLTGAPCPLCGGIRACAALVQGDFAAAYALNPGLMPVLALAAVHSLLLLAQAATGRTLYPPGALKRAWTWAGAALLFFWLLRLYAL